VRIAVLAPLVSPIAEPHIGGSQALLSDLAVGLAGRGHEVRVYA
jgi:UDP-glucose:tetrahydrobiopterin glucosyltransferase